MIIFHLKIFLMNRQLCPYMKKFVISLTWKRIRHTWTKFHIEKSSFGIFGYDSLIQFIPQRIITMNKNSDIFPNINLTCLCVVFFLKIMWQYLFFSKNHRRSINNKILMTWNKCRNFNFQRDQIRRQPRQETWQRRITWTIRHCVSISTSFFSWSFRNNHAMSLYLCISRNFQYVDPWKNVLQYVCTWWVMENTYDTWNMTSWSGSVVAIFRELHPCAFVIIGI